MMKRANHETRNLMTDIKHGCTCDLSVFRQTQWAHPMASREIEPRMGNVGGNDRITRAMKHHRQQLLLCIMAEKLK
ncbi:hypothetical protein GCM10011607_39740 [Shewanella inventionis]|uniref:Uncharacterized protein n=1 Tax=Shewanella inventionis TaxID=1738770 RepID=A0ABQ1JV73_9GAMM|nr:hypothetical protein GCM10011607_39740 [Shewanella inventionis]